MPAYVFKAENYKKELLSIYKDLISEISIDEDKLGKIVRKYPKDVSQLFTKDNLVRGFDFLKNEDLFDDNELSQFSKIIKSIRLKPTRTISGVTTVTVLTKPFACPGKCIFCPNDVRMPKSYIATEPGAQRALYNRFSPYLQVYNRLKAYKNTGHPTDKVELLILGGTWSYYPEKYKVWFIHECFRAMNDFGEGKYFPNEDDETIKTSITQELKEDPNEAIRSVEGDKPYNQLIVSKTFKEKFGNNIAKETQVNWEDLFSQHNKNSNGKCRCVGLVLETRSDVITEKEVLSMRKLGATKVQLGIQTLDDHISELNERGETKAQVANAFKLLRTAGFKIHGHIMPNLYGSTPERDLEVYKELFESLDFKPDELKIYPASVIKHTKLHEYFEQGKFRPYTTEELVDLIANFMRYTPEYCRLTRVIRDIPSTEIEVGNKTTNLREVAEHRVKQNAWVDKNIRAREIKGKSVKFEDLHLDIIEYECDGATELFLQYITDKREIAGFLRLSLPGSSTNQITQELDNCAIIREVHVYGPSLGLDDESKGEAQHLGLGTKLIEKAKEIAKSKSFEKLAVISAIGTREYYKKRGFELVEFYQIFEGSQ